MANAVALAKEWVRRGNCYYAKWIDSGGEETFAAPAAHDIPEDIAFLDWSLEQDVHGHIMSEIKKIRDTVPVKAPAAG